MFCKVEHDTDLYYAEQSRRDRVWKHICEACDSLHISGFVWFTEYAFREFEYSTSLPEASEIEQMFKSWLEKTEFKDCQSADFMNYGMSEYLCAFICNYVPITLELISNSLLHSGIKNMSRLADLLSVNRVAMYALFSGANYRKIELTLRKYLLKNCYITES